MDKNTRLLLSILGIAVLMVGVAFASVPLYNLFCKVTGFGGTTQVSDVAPDEILEREVTVLFNTDTSRDMPWEFESEKRKITLPVGAQRLINFKAENNSADIITGTALYNVSPPKAGKYFHKMECFCFQEQVLNPGESVNMPVVFYIDPAMDEDINMDDVTTITLSYTFFKTETKALDEALDNFYNAGGS